MKRLALLATVLVACSGHAPASPASSHRAQRWVVVGPHPDDAVLVASGVMRRAVEAKAPVAMIVLTNGDLDCLHDGLVRDAESLAAARALGLHDDDVHFLGYPDGGLAALGRTPLPPRRRLVGGQCTEGTLTYGHGVAEAKPYTREDAVADLARVLEELEPTDLVVTHPEDTHPDHAAAYSLVRSAIDRLAFAPVIHRALVHNGDCWPTGPSAHEPCPPGAIAPDRPTPPLTGRLAGYVPRERIRVPASCLVPDPAQNPKLLAIGAHASQTRSSFESYLFAFAKSDEPFFPERFAHGGTRWMRADAPVLVLTRASAPGERLDVEGYAVTLGEHSATLARPPREWPLPHDVFATGAESFELAVAREPDDGVTEITLRVRGRIAGVAVDVSASPSARPGP